MRDLLTIAARSLPAALAARSLTESYREWLAHDDPATEADDAEDQGRRFTYLMRYGNLGPARVTSACLDPDSAVLLLAVQSPTDTPAGIPVTPPRRRSSVSCCSRPASDRPCSSLHLAPRPARTSWGLVPPHECRHTDGPGDHLAGAVVAASR